MNGEAENFRIVITGPTRDSGGMMALTREPSVSRASTIGLDSSMRRPIGEMILSMMRMTWSSFWKTTLVSSRRPLRSMYTWRGPLTMISVTVSSRRSGSMGPRPMISSVICSSIRTRSARVRARPSSSMTRPKISSIWRRTST